MRQGGSWRKLHATAHLQGRCRVSVLSCSGAGRSEEACAVLLCTRDCWRLPRKGATPLVCPGCACCLLAGRRTWRAAYVRPWRHHCSHCCHQDGKRAGRAAGAAAGGTGSSGGCGGGRARESAAFYRPGSNAAGGRSRTSVCQCSWDGLKKVPHSSCSCIGGTLALACPPADIFLFNEGKG